MTADKTAPERDRSRTQKMGAKAPTQQWTRPSLGHRPADPGCVADCLLSVASGGRGVTILPVGKHSDHPRECWLESALVGDGVPALLMSGCGA